ncbi:MAG: T9SS type A sorting domain-containing protein [Bacteroidales bacterium]|nr:T9SS type A sorting domain-containing protein [Bacteroidales bacterium]
MLKRVSILVFLTISSALYSQTVLTIEGTSVIDTESGNWAGVNIPRSVPTSFIYRNNSITSINSEGYLLQAGDEVQNSRNNNLDGMVITGNNFTWNGTDASSITHALFTGYNINSSVKYNYLENTPHGILFKSGSPDGFNMTFTSGGAAYNIVKNAKLSLRIKGMNGVRVYNNTFYNDAYTDLSSSIIEIDANNDSSVPSPSLGARIFNNVFYTKYRIPNVRIESWCLNDFESDYNVFWCEAGPPVFVISGELKTFAEWQALGYDTHSIVVDPGFNNTTDFIPASRLDYATDLGTEFQTGLSEDAVWSSSDPATASQDGTWQAGARILTSHSGNQAVNIYPNPATDHINISIPERTEVIDYIRIVNLSGKDVFHSKVDPDVREIQIRINMPPGFYFVMMGLNNHPYFTEKLVIKN